MKKSARIQKIMSKLSEHNARVEALRKEEIIQEKFGEIY